MKTNKKGMTLVECIIAMAVFAIATTGFTMVATTCMKAQAKASRRMTATNNQTTNLEHFSSYSKVLDPEYCNVKPMSTGINKFKMTFDFGTVKVENDDIYGYRSVLDPSSPDGVFELSFFSAAEQVDLAEGEYWITLYNNSSSQHTWDINCAVPGDSQVFEFFNNEHDNSIQQALPRHIWAPNGGYMKFGFKQRTPGVGDLSSCLEITDVEANPPVTYRVGLSSDNLISEDKNYCAIYFDDGVFKSAKQFEEDHKDPDE